jgi:hypothetical protein
MTVADELPPVAAPNVLMLPLARYEQLLKLYQPDVWLLRRIFEHAGKEALAVSRRQFATYPRFVIDLPQRN